MLLRYLLKSLIFIFLFSSCSTLKLSYRGKVYSSAVLGFTGGAIYGLNQKQARRKNAFFFGTSFGLLASLISLALFEEEQKTKALDGRLSQLQKDFIKYNDFKNQYLTRGNSGFIKEDRPGEINTDPDGLVFPCK